MRKLIFWAVLLSTLMVQSCASPEQLMQKALEKGAKIHCVTDTVMISDTIIQNGDTIIFDRPHYIVRDSIVYKTKWQTKYEYKTIKAQEKTKQVEAKEDTKQVKSDNKVEKTKEKQKNKVGKLSEIKHIIYAILFVLIGLIALILVIRYAKNYFNRL